MRYQLSVSPLAQDRIDTTGWGRVQAVEIAFCSLRIGAIQPIPERSQSRCNSMSDSSVTDIRALKYAAAARALDYVEPGMKLGLGSGSTSAAFVDLLGVKVRDGLKVVCTSTSVTIEHKARSLGIELKPLAELAPLDLAVDGADEIDPDLNLIKGGGGALTREKIVEASAKRLVVIADGSKWVQRLGRFALPVEVVSFGHETTAARIGAVSKALGYPNLPMALRQTNGAVFKTDNGNVIYDCRYQAIVDVPALADALANIAGVVEHGLFVGMAEAAILARTQGVAVMSRL
jgi:ribose 5-phosphate isomerase A